MLRKVRRQILQSNISKILSVASIRKPAHYLVIELLGPLGY